MPELIIDHAPETVDLESPSQVAQAAGLWSLSYERLALLDASWAGPPTVLVAAEDVRIVAVDLPIANRNQRMAALPFVIEDQVSEPIEALHTALGQALSPGRYLAGVVRHDRMARWCALVEAAGLSRAAIVPDALMLPAPGSGFWSVAARGERVLVRTAEGPAFAVPSNTFSGVWQASSRPELISYGDALPADLPSQPAGPGWRGLSPGIVPVLNLRQGPYAARAEDRPWLRRLGLILGAGLLAHTTIFAIDTVVLMQTAEARKAEVATLVAATGAPVDGDLAARAMSMLPGSAGSPSGLLPLFGRAATALQPVAATVSLQSAKYDARGSLTLDVEAADLAGLQQAEAALKTAGLNPVAGASSVRDGRARQSLVIAGAGSSR